MKTVIRICFFAIAALVIYSCNKSNDLVPGNPPPAATPNITSKIFPFTNQPAAANLGTPQAVFQQGQVITLYVAYGVGNDKVVTASLSLNDAGSGDLINTYMLVPSSDPSAAQLQVPTDLRDVPFMFATFTLDSTYLSKAVNVYSNITGGKVASADSLGNAFSVQ